MAVGIVLVAHSAGLAAEAVALVRGIAGADAPVAAAGGTADGGLGTSLDLIEKAVAAVDQGDGVVIVPDLGSSVLTALLVEDPGRVVVADVPFVEGAIAAAVTAGAGAALPAVLSAAEDAWRYRKFSDS
ncbi:phosphoenolpyruvate--protein phosphotransferase [Nonomuraea rhizosphaerae]|uniref:PTS sugar transporter subunit IIA domain-containing protein n=1 Tax=Nonomuraea rhizosphaerae TaxID=2665663 RepID=UPI0027E29117|nr:phosphoenolpyruvate--protein phosphotransferase [Nonomuraea rhizosphaerae]